MYFACGSQTCVKFDVLSMSWTQGPSLAEPEGEFQDATKTKFHLIVEDAICCAICLDPYSIKREPVVFECGHTFCEWLCPFWGYCLLFR